MRVALVTCLEKPEADPDESLLCEALARRGVAVEMAAWDDEGVDWTVYVLAVVRSTWNYMTELERFERWMVRASAKTELLNPPPIAHWNLDKHYLADLERRGVAIVPTRFAERGADAAEALAACAWEEIVVKPTVGAGSFHARRFGAGERDAARAFLDEELGERAMMIQPYLTAVEGHGERACVWIEGELTHAVRKTPRFAGEHEAVSAAVEPTDAERELALRALAPHAASLLYGRVDVVPGADGAPCVMELELVEPSLFLLQHPPALERFAAAIAARARSVDRRA
jgi:glutathione synthase/RimK-type ligase-like ATP-grasp enzyme